MAAWYAVASLDALRAALVLGVGSFAALAVFWPAARRWLPERTCQVPSALMRYSRNRAALRWGVELGTGLRTFVVTPGMYALLAVVVVQPRPLVAAALCALYGAARGVTIACFALVYARRRGREKGVPGLGLERALRVPVAITIVSAVFLALP